MCCFFFFKQKTAYEMRISDWSSDVCSSDLRRQQHHVGLERLLAAVGLRRGDRGGLRRAVLQADDVEGLRAVEAERLRVLAVLELQREHAHADQVGAVDALEALGDHGLDAQQDRALGRPGARDRKSTRLNYSH